MNTIKALVAKLIKKAKPKEPTPLWVGQMWQMRDVNPFNPRLSRAKVLDILEGYVKYAISDGTVSAVTYAKIENFREIYPTLMTDSDDRLVLESIRKQANI